MKFSELEKVAAERVENLQHCPEARYRSRQKFYRRYGFRSLSRVGLGAAELAFLRWGIARGVYNRLDDPKPGSPYWRTTNDAICYCSELGALAWERGIGSEVVRPEVRFWVEYLCRPSAESWYRAHNTSLIWGMIKHRAEALREPFGEQLFINAALYRLLYAEALVHGAVFGSVGRWLVDPGLFAVPVILRLPALYPDQYPVCSSGEDNGPLKALDRVGRSLFLKLESGEAILRMLVGRYLVPLVEHTIPEAELYGLFARAAPIYPRVLPASVRRRAGIHLLGDLVRWPA